MSQPTTLADRLAATAAGTWGEEAAIWLLDTHGHWLPELERCGHIHTQPANWPSATVIDGYVGDDHHLIGTPSEGQVLDIAMALYRGDTQTSLGQLTSLDEQNRRLILHAVAWAAGGRHWADSLNLTAAPTT
jgi:hypothetical protein